MVLPNLFSRSPGKKTPKDSDVDSDYFQQRKSSRQSSRQVNSPLDSPRKTPSLSPSKSPAKSPTKSSTKSPTKNSRRDTSRPTSSHSHLSPTRPRESSNFTYDRNSHPLNLPPDELRRLSAMSAKENMRDGMDVEPPQEPTSPQPTPSAPTANAPGAFPATNGANDAMDEKSPTPPPHKAASNTMPAPKPTVDAEACKAAGNKFFKAKDYDRAITEYTKGKAAICVLVKHLNLLVQAR